MSHTTSLRFDYKYKSLDLFWGLVCTGIFMSSLAYTASTNKSKLRVYLLILDVNQASVFFWPLFALFSFVFLLLCFLYLKSLNRPKCIELRQSEIYLLKSAISSKMFAIPYKAICDTIIRKAARGRMLVINTNTQQFLIASRNFNSDLEFEIFMQSFRERLEPR